MTAWFELMRVELKLFTRNLPAFLFSLVFPSLMLLIFGGIYGNDPSPLFGGHGTVDVSLPSYTALIIATNGIMTLPLALVSYREGGVLKRLQASPITPVHLLVAQIIVNLAATIGGMVLLAAVAGAVFHVRFQGALGPSMGAFLISTVSIFAIGYLIAGVAPGTRACTALANLLFFPMIFLSGATVPREIMSATMQAISRYLPLTHAVELLKGVWLGGSLAGYTTQLLILGAVAVTGAAGAVLTFRWE